MDNSVMDNASELNQTPANSVAEVTEKTFSQSQVNEIVGNAKRDVAERAAERAIEAYKREQAQLQGNSQSHNQSPSSHGLSEDEIKRLTGDEIKRHFQQVEQQAQKRSRDEAAQRIIDTFRDKVKAGMDKHEDFVAVAGSVEMWHYPNVVQLLAEQVDNSADILYHLAKNRTKLHELESIHAHNPSDAIYEIKRLSDSIKANEQSSQMKHPNAPLSQQRSSATGTDSRSALSWDDLKKKYKA